MTRRRFYAPSNSFSPDGRSVTLQTDEARHLRDALRLKPGDEVYVFDGEGREVVCAVQSVRRDTGELAILRDVEPARTESPLKLTLGVALLKSDKFDLVVQKATELGITSISPVITKQADIRLRDESDAFKRVTRWQRIAMEAAKQSGRAIVPRVSLPIPFNRFLLEHPAAALFLFSERSGKSILEVKSELGEGVDIMTALVGPEGGWTDEELTQAVEQGWTIITLGGRTLRAETAAICATALLQHLFGDLI